MKNKFIVLEGIDGCGKGTQIKKLHNFIFEQDKKNEIFTTREPTYGNYGMKIREILKKDNCPFKNSKNLLNLYTKDRKEHTKLIKKFISRKKGKIKYFVLSDRYYHSTYAYQQTQGIDFKIIHKTQKGFLKPDITIILDLKPEIAYKRMEDGRTSKEKFEKLEFMEELRKNFLNLREKLDENICVVDSSKSKIEVFEQIIKVLKENEIIF